MRRSFFFFAICLLSLDLAFGQEMGYQHFHSVSGHSITSQPVPVIMDSTGLTTAIASLQNDQTLAKRLLIAQFDETGIPTSAQIIGEDSLFLDHAQLTSDSSLLVLARIFPNGQVTTVLKLSASGSILWARALKPQTAGVFGSFGLGIVETDSAYQVHVRTPKPFVSGEYELAIIELDKATGEGTTTTAFRRFDSFNVIRGIPLSDESIILTGSMDRFGREPVLFRMDKDQMISWSFHFNDPYLYEMNVIDAVLGDSGAVYVTGDLATSSSALKKDGFLMKIRTDGSISFFQLFREPAQNSGERMFKILEMDSTQIILAGVHTASNSKQYFLLRTDQTGQVQQTFGMDPVDFSPVFSNNSNRYQNAVPFDGGVKIFGQMIDENEGTFGMSQISINNLLVPDCAATISNLTMEDSSLTLSSSTFSVSPSSIIYSNDPAQPGVSPVSLPTTDVCSGATLSNDLEIRPVISVYPNPADQVLFIDNYAPNRGSRMTIIDMMGRQMMVSEGKTEIDISSLPSGTYLLLLTEENRAPFSIRFIKS